MSEPYSPPRLKVNPARLWLLPTLMATVVMAALAAMYIGSIAKPAQHLDSFPIAVVNEDHAVTTNGQKVDAGAQVAAGLNRRIDHDKFDVQNLTLSQARSKLDKGELYGAIVLPSDLSRSLSTLASSAAKDSRVDYATVRVLTSPQAGSATVSVVTNLANSSIDSASAQVGKQLVGNVTKQAQAQQRRAAQNGQAQAGQQGAADGGLSGAARLALSDPLRVEVAPYKALPDGSGNGLLPFYYALVLVLAGFTGSLIVSTLMDNDLGVTPSEIGPSYVLRPRSNVTRLQTLALKWGVMLTVAVLTSAAYLGLAHWLGVQVDHPWALWFYGVLVISAVAFVAQTINAILGGLGMIVNLFVFVILSLPSAGGSMPLEETPAIYRWLGSFEPMHQIYLGTRAILFYDAQWDAGLGRGVIYSTFALLLGLLVGLAVTLIYDSRGHVRYAGEVPSGRHDADLRDADRDDVVPGSRQVDGSEPSAVPAGWVTTSAGGRTEPKAHGRRPKP